MLKTVSAKHHNEKETLDAGYTTDEWISIGRYFVEAGPGVRDRCVGQRRQASHGHLHDFWQKVPLHGRVERRCFVGIPHPEQDARAFAMEIEGGLEVDDHDLVLR